MTYKNGYCPACDAERELKVKVVEQTFPVRGEPIKVETEVAFCTVCGGEVPDQEMDFTALERAYAKYRRLKDLPAPDQIIALRKEYGLGQRALAKLLGWSPATLYRYEKGAIPVPAHAEIIKRLADSKEMAKLVEEHADRLTPREIARVRKRIKPPAKNEEGAITRSAVEKWAASLTIGPESGFRRFNFDKLLNMMVFFARKKGISKTSLMKRLWYADFLHFKKHGVSISGACYARLPHGPALEKWMLCLQAATDAGAVSIESVPIADQDAEIVAEIVHAETDVDESAFTLDELETLKEVAERLEGYTAKALSEMSHAEDAWKLTPNNKMISYEYAANLHLGLDRGTTSSPGQVETL